MSEVIQVYLPVDLREDEVLSKARELARVEQDYNARELKKKQDTKEHNDALKSLRQLMKELSHEIREEKEVRLVDCEDRKNFKNKTMDRYRLDTGEFVSSRPLCESELNGELDFGAH